MAKNDEAAKKEMKVVVRKPPRRGETPKYWAADPAEGFSISGAVLAEKHKKER
ncbi:hypothetical protein [Actinoplanes regularis]|uniref:hypothetical protein n=1 Tax=Actinoplanes regularis TaxID=52697 RepID=UPI0024A3BC52|nr:hypothetical protein [Actinoplanes regularis]GLW32296.1 hypothetical protein Areg01_52350 [Actinoplanes regularis]